MSFDGSEWIFMRFYEIIARASYPKYPLVPYQANQAASDFTKRKQDMKYRPDTQKGNIPGDKAETRKQWKAMFKKITPMTDEDLAVYVDTHEDALSTAIRFLQEPDDISLWDKFINFVGRDRDGQRLRIIDALRIMRKANSKGLTTDSTEETLDIETLSKVKLPPGVILPDKYKDVDIKSVIEDLARAPTDENLGDDEQTLEVTKRILKVTRKDKLKRVIISVVGGAPQLDPEIRDMLREYIAQGPEDLAIASAQAFRWKESIPVIEFEKRLSTEKSQKVKKHFAEALSTSPDPRVMSLLIRLLLDKKNTVEDQKWILDQLRMWFIGLGHDREKVVRGLTEEMPAALQEKLFRVLNNIEAMDWITSPGQNVWVWMGRVAGPGDDPDIKDPEMKGFIKQLKQFNAHYTHADAEMYKPTHIN